LKAYYFLSDQHSLQQNIPMVVVLHGCSQNAKTVAKESGWNELAVQYGFFVLYPEQKRINNSSNCFNWFLEKDFSGKKGELESIRNMIYKAIDSFSVDTSRIFVYGLSAGGALSVALMANYPDFFQSGAVLAAGPYFSATGPVEALKTMRKPKKMLPCEWAAPVKAINPSADYPELIIVHGEEDKMVNIGNSVQLINQWSCLLDMDTIPDEVDTNFSGVKEVTQILYQNMNTKKSVVFYRIKGLGHALPVDPGSEPKQGGSCGRFSKDIGFFSTYYIAKYFELF
ncbi:MAG: hypothetical protein C0594_12145, partial [Marinilabiliales bacterium]